MAKGRRQKAEGKAKGKKEEGIRRGCNYLTAVQAVVEIGKVALLGMGP
jgi:hypothetical protein